MTKPAEDVEPRRSVRSLIGVWEQRIADEAQAAAAVRQRTDRAKKPKEAPSVRQHSAMTPPVVAEPQRAPELAKPKFAKATKHDARLRLSRLPEPFGWGKKGRTRG
jgi:hypothetical protein